MGSLPCELDGASIVLLGRLNPAIFHPAWFAANDLIRPEEGAKATIQIISPEIPSFDLGWMRVLTQAERFTASCSGPDGFEPMRDLVVGAFMLLEHTPIERL